MEAGNGGTEGSDMEGEHTVDKVIGELDGSFKHLLEGYKTLKQTPGKQTTIQDTLKERKKNKGSYTSSDAEEEAERLFQGEMKWLDEMYIQNVTGVAKAGREQDTGRE